MSSRVFSPRRTAVLVGLAIALAVMVPRAAWASVAVTGFNAANNNTISYGVSRDGSGSSGNGGYRVIFTSPTNVPIEGSCHHIQSGSATNSTHALGQNAAVVAGTWTVHTAWYGTTAAGQTCDLSAPITPISGSTGTQVITGGTISLQQGWASFGTARPGGFVTYRASATATSSAGYKVGGIRVNATMADTFDRFSYCSDVISTTGCSSPGDWADATGVVHDQTLQNRTFNVLLGDLGHAATGNVWIRAYVPADASSGSPASGFMELTSVSTTNTGGQSSGAGGSTTQAYADLRVPSLAGTSDGGTSATATYDAVIRNNGPSPSGVFTVTLEAGKLSGVTYCFVVEEVCDHAAYDPENPPTHSLAAGDEVQMEVVGTKTNGLSSLRVTVVPNPSVTDAVGSNNSRFARA